VPLKEVKMDVVKIGFIGAGGLANSMHYPSLAECEDVEIAAICDINEQRLNSTADKYGIESRFRDYRKMLESGDFDAIYVIMPPHHLYDIVVDVLESKHNVFIEKPPGVTTFQTRSLARLAERNGCKTMCGFNRRFIPLHLRVKKAVEEQGPIIQCKATFYKSSPNLYYRGSIDVLTSDGIHAVDMLRWMGGEAVEVHSLISKFEVDIENSFNALLRYESGGVGELCTNWRVGTRIHSFEMHSFGISALINPDDKAIIYREGEKEPQIITTQDAAGSKENRKYYGFYHENRHFIDCIKEDRDPETCFSDAVKTMELVDRIWDGSIHYMGR
jgi:predicted dehydrogenase